MYVPSLKSHGQIFDTVAIGLLSVHYYLQWPAGWCGQLFPCRYAFPK